MTNLVPPHGSKHLKTLTMKVKELEAEKFKAGSLLKVYCSSREFGDVIMLGIGGFTPLDGFMNEDNWQSVCDNMVMTNGIFWPIPITLSSDDETINIGDEISIIYKKNNEIISTMVISEKYAIDKIHECNKVFKTTDSEHPGVALVMAQGKYNLAGKIKVLSNGGFPNKYGDLYMTCLLYTSDAADE